MKKSLTVFVGFILLFLLYWVVYAAAPEFHARWLQGEDRGVEWVTFIGFLGASFVLFFTLRSWKKMPRFARLYILMTGLFFFVCAGEELSWGQRIFGFKTPESIDVINRQGEANLHNINFRKFRESELGVWCVEHLGDTAVSVIERLRPSDVVSWYMKLFGIILPLVLVVWMRKKDSALRGYLSPPELIPCFLFPEIIHLIHPWTSRFGSWLIRPDAAHLVYWQNEEVLEMYWGLCILLAALAISTAWRKRSACHPAE